MYELSPPRVRLPWDISIRDVFPQYVLFVVVLMLVI